MIRISKIATTTIAMIAPVLNEDPPERFRTGFPQAAPRAHRIRASAYSSGRALVDEPPDRDLRGWVIRTPAAMRLRHTPKRGVSPPRCSARQRTGSHRTSTERKANAGERAARSVRGRAGHSARRRRGHGARTGAVRRRAGLSCLPMRLLAGERSPSDREAEGAQLFPALVGDP